MKTLVLGLLVAAAPLCTAATTPAAKEYVVDLTIRDGETVVGHPVLRISSGQEARFEIGKRPGLLYSISLLASPVAPGTVDTRWHVDVVSDAGDRSFAPRLVVREQEPSAIAYGNTQKPLRLNFTIRSAS